jgi:hypothetical protein
MPIQAILAAVGVATSVYGAYKSHKEGKKQSKLSAKQDALNAQISAQSRAIEKVRQEQAAFDRLKTERNIIRQSQLARATAVSRASNQGATGFVTGQGGGSSALQGAFGQIAGQTGDALTTLQTNFGFGQRVFKANDNIARFGGQVNALQSQIYSSQAKQNFGKEIFNFGANLVQNSTGYGSTLESLPGLFGR